MLEVYLDPLVSLLKSEKPEKAGLIASALMTACVQKFMDSGVFKTDVNLLLAAYVFLKILASPEGSSSFEDFVNCHHTREFKTNWNTTNQPVKLNIESDSKLRDTVFNILALVSAESKSDEPMTQFALRHLCRSDESRVLIDLLARGTTSSPAYQTSISLLPSLEGDQLVSLRAKYVFLQQPADMLTVLQLFGVLPKVGQPWELKHTCLDSCAAKFESDNDSEVCNSCYCLKDTVTTVLSELICKKLGRQSKL